MGLLPDPGNPRGHWKTAITTLFGLFEFVQMSFRSMLALDYALFVGTAFASQMHVVECQSSCLMKMDTLVELVKLKSLDGDGIVVHWSCL